MKFRKKHQEKEDEDEKHELSLLSKALLIIALATSIFFMKIPLATTFLFCFLVISTAFDVYRQEQERKRGEK